jgi:hypothetical protein
MKYAWLLIFLLFLLLLMLYFKSASTNSYVGSFVQTFKNEINASKWYLLGKIKIEAGKVIWFNWNNQ